MEFGSLKIISKAQNSLHNYIVYDHTSELHTVHYYKTMHLKKKRSISLKI